MPKLQESTNPEELKRELRRALGQFATGVTVIATRSTGGSLVGVTANSFSALSLEPPLVVWSLRLNSSSLEAFVGSGRFVVSVLSESQVALSRNFAAQSTDKFNGIPCALNEHEMPLLHGACAWFECKTVSTQTAGDHCLFIAEVERFSSSEGAPLVFHSGHYASLGSRL
jgi:flavin reductase (DIM6/NTAB) family NADH-FMN oxidoreductase RutF